MYCTERLMRRCIWAYMWTECRFVDPGTKLDLFPNLFHCRYLMYNT